MKVFAGIDPGISKTAPGGIAILNYQEKMIDCFPWPGNISDVNHKIIEWKKSFEINLCILERITGNPKWGASQTKLFCNFGVWRGLLTAHQIPFVELTSNQWQKGIINKCDGRDTKERVRDFVGKRFPFFKLPAKKYHGVLDALAMAVKASQIYNDATTKMGKPRKW